MDSSTGLTSSSRLHRMRVQGYCNYSDENLSGLAFGNRFAYILCSTILLFAVITANIPILFIMMIISLLGFFLPNHPFDYIYNYLMRGIVNKPKLPSRSKQLKFTCALATVWLLVTIYLFNAGLATAGYVLGGLLTSVALLVSYSDICIPSIIYNFLFRYEVK